MLLPTLLFLCCFAQLQADSLDIYREKAADWQDDVEALVAQNKEKTAGPNDLLFLGSSSIRLWESIEEDMGNWGVVRRGYGGARYSDLAIYLDPLLAEHQPKAILFFVANDIAGDEKRDVSPEEVGRLTKLIATRTREHFPTTPIFFIEITPTLKRWHVRDLIVKANAEIRKTVESTKNCYFIATWEDYLDPSTREPIEKNYREDKLHLSDKGYDLWGEIIQRNVREVMK